MARGAGRLIPRRVHGILDVGLGILLVVLPFLTGYSEESGGTAFHIVMGLAFIGSGMMTRWDEADLLHSMPSDGTHSPTA